MRIAYIISAFKQPEQLVRLILRLNTDTATFFIHIDRKSAQEVYDRALAGTLQLPNVTFLKRYRCYWGGFGHVQATMEGIKEIIKRNIQYDYVILLTGQDYPIKTNRQIQDFFDANRGRLFINHFALPTEEWEGGGLQRVQLWHFRWHHRHYAFPRNPEGNLRRRFPRGFRVFGGSSYWCLTKECIEYIYQFLNLHPGFVKFFQYVDVPDEIFFQTIVMNSPYAQNVVNDDMRYIDWKCPEASSPGLLGKDDLRKLIASPKLFARKFDESVDSEILDLIDQEILCAI